jgi:hypothetical protein
MENEKGFTKLNLKYLCEFQKTTIKELFNLLGFKSNRFDVVALVKVCNYFKVNMDAFVFTDLQKNSKEI